eukprot:GEZU01008444.1.p1 GENE.GEZU01008444.1~~GEZU01008444.1.p1  ORF type:complete len:312 (+),score=107.03 GEZU01008444.1:579-1514(+)
MPAEGTTDNNNNDAEAPENESQTDKGDVNNAEASKTTKAPKPTTTAVAPAAKPTTKAFEVSSSWSDDEEDEEDDGESSTDKKQEEEQQNNDLEDLKKMVQQAKLSDANQSASNNKKKKKKNKQKQKKATEQEAATVTQRYRFPAHALDIFEEPEPLDAESSEFKHEQKLLKQYKQALAAGQTADGPQFADEAETDHDKAFYIFSKRLARCPTQVVRWKQNGSPLWISGEPHTLPNNIPACESCGAPRVFELQVLSTAVYFLKPGQHNHIRASGSGEMDEGLDFGTAAIYTCSVNCGTNKYSKEYVHVQPAI